MRRRTAAATLAATLALGLAGVVAPQGAAAAVPGGCSHTPSSNRPVLRSGSTGAAVKQAQCLTNVWGGVPKLTVDGVFGANTLKKIKWIQGCHGLTKDGVIGAKTWNALYYPAQDCYDPYPG
ncbi:MULTISPECIES: peptidoglycan-binding domain-containing protein [unclassified Streptomyces]|uniref:peptidoglycan-binding domain-containing protein n=1 Tax=unclassified Streptomyces TaxID=2593676 RepID=UPI002237E397|nr:peptidoglycan-binding domain-containing protein [Streptomyces sp. SHP 1-2]MCW5250331.1 peptidoglycan-binding protein [Streptomyces sp. SHP 1-2]